MNRRVYTLEYTASYRSEIFNNEIKIIDTHSHSLSSSQANLKGHKKYVVLGYGNGIGKQVFLQPNPHSGQGVEPGLNRVRVGVEATS